MSIKWQKSGVRKNRFVTRVAGKRVIIEKRTGIEWILTEDGRKVAGARDVVILGSIAEEHYTNGLSWQQALAITDAKVAATLAARTAAAKAKA